MKHLTEYRDPKIIKTLARSINERAEYPVRIMEVCGTHTVSIFRHGLRDLLHENVILVSGPGCPVCVTPTGEIDALIELAALPKVVLAVFGDILRVPGSRATLSQIRAQGSDVRLVYSPYDALELAQKMPDKEVIFSGIGFETTAPGIAACLLSARKQAIKNFSVFSSLRRMVPALQVLLSRPDISLGGLLLPGHVSTIIGANAYQCLADTFHLPMVVAGFEPADILLAIHCLVSDLKAPTQWKVGNKFPRAVTCQGNTRAREIMNAVFEPAPAHWRALGQIAESGLAIREELKDMDAAVRFDISVNQVPDPSGCACAKVLLGAAAPKQCPLFG
ncbi:MAG: hydrogenase formation protein HypD, partial [Pseudomonadota bacterium]